MGFFCSCDKHSGVFFTQGSHHGVLHRPALPDSVSGHCSDAKGWRHLPSPQSTSTLAQWGNVQTPRDGGISPHPSPPARWHSGAMFRRQGMEASHLTPVHPHADTADRTFPSVLVWSLLIDRPVCPYPLCKTTTSCFC